MSEEKLESYFFTALLLGVLVVVGAVFYPFIGSLALAIVLASLAAPFYIWLRKRIASKNFAAFLVTLAVTLSIILPAVGLSFLLVDEVQSISENIATYDLANVPQVLQSYYERIVTIFPPLATVDLQGIVKSSFEGLGTTFNKVVTSTASFILKFVVAIIALFYFVKDGKQFLNEIVQLSPLKDSEDVMIVRKLDRVTHSLIRGTLVIAVIQGLLVGLGFLIFGVPNPVLWGSFASIGALIPTVGTGIVTAPAILYLFLTGQIAEGIGLLAWSMFLVGLVDNIIGPKLIGDVAKIHPLFVLLSVLGGIALFGLAGFLLGPLLFGFLMALAEIYKVKIKEMHSREMII